MNKDELNDEIVNTGLAEVMGLNSDYLKDLIKINRTMIKPKKEIPDKIYTESLDALVPVWEKLKIADSNLCPNYKDEAMCMVTIDCINFFDGYGKTIQQAASYATYKACKELGLIKEMK